jgi:hypothetical protein
VAGLLLWCASAQAEDQRHTRHRIAFREAREDELHHEPIGMAVGPKFISPDVGRGLRQEGVEDGPDRWADRPMLINCVSELPTAQLFSGRYSGGSHCHAPYHGGG